MSTKQQDTRTTDTCTEHRTPSGARRLVALAVSALLALLLAPMPSGHAAATGSIAGKLHAKKKYLENAVVYVASVPGKPKPPSKPVTMDQRNHTFIPAVLPVVVGSTVRFLNSDPEAHNVFSPEGKYDLGNWTKGDHRDHVFDKQGAYTQLCHLHPTMIGYVLVLQNAHFAVAGPDGSFRIDGVPPGSYQVEVWQERGGSAPTKVTVESGKTADVTIEVGKRRRK